MRACVAPIAVAVGHWGNATPRLTEPLLVPPQAVPLALTVAG